MTASPIAPPAATVGLVEALTAHGWTHTGPMRIDPQWRSVCQTLADPEGRMNLDVAAFPDGNLTVSLTAEALRGSDGRLVTPAWMVDLSEWPREAVLACTTAITTATEPAASLPDALRQAGWQQLPDICEAGRLLERSWANPERTASVTWAPADDFDDGGWGVIRENGDGQRREANVSQHVPEQVLTALALADWQAPDIGVNGTRERGES